LQRLLSEPLSLRSLRKIQAAALDVAGDVSQPLGYFVVASIAGSMAEGMEGDSVSADAAQVRDEVVRPALAAVVAAAETPDVGRLVSVSNDAIRSFLLSR
jgi:anti-sigma factor RsiW